MAGASGDKGFGDAMSEQEKGLWLEGIVHRRYTLLAPWLGAEIECGDATWVIATDDLSPYHAFAERRVMASGAPYEPKYRQRILSRVGEKPIRHFRVSTMRLAEATPDAWLTEVGEEQRLAGRFERGAGDGGEAALSFVTEEGVAFLVANEPPGAAAGGRVEVTAYPVLPTPSSARRLRQSLWVICPYTHKETWEWRRRPDAGLPCGVYVDADSGQLRRRRTPAEPHAADRPRD